MLAIECYALDLSAYNLLFDGTHKDRSGNTKSLYEQLVTEKLLFLAIAIRTKIYQGLKWQSNEAAISHCGFLRRIKNGKEEPLELTIKAFCDKVIHADSLKKYLEAGVEKPILELTGTDQKQCEWVLSVSVSLFSESVLNWLEHAEET